MRFAALVMSLCCIQQVRAQEPPAKPLPRCMIPAADTTGRRQLVTSTIAPLEIKLPTGFARQPPVADSSTGAVIQRETWVGPTPPLLVSITRIASGRAARIAEMDFGTPSQHLSSCVDSIGGVQAMIVTNRVVTPPGRGADSLVVYSTVGRFALGPNEFVDVTSRPTPTLAGQQALLPIIFSVRLVRASRRL